MDVVVYVSCMYACMMYVVWVFLTFAGLFAGLEWHVISSIPLILTPTHSTPSSFQLGVNGAEVMFKAHSGMPAHRAVGAMQCSFMHFLQAAPLGLVRQTNLFLSTHCAMMHEFSAAKHFAQPLEKPKFCSMHVIMLGAKAQFCNLSGMSFLEALRRILMSCRLPQYDALESWRELVALTLIFSLFGSKWEYTFRRTLRRCPGRRLLSVYSLLEPAYAVLNVFRPVNQSSTSNKYGAESRTECGKTGQQNFTWLEPTS